MNALVYVSKNVSLEHFVEWKPLFYEELVVEFNEKGRTSWLSLWRRRKFLPIDFYFYFFFAEGIYTKPFFIASSSIVASISTS